LIADILRLMGFSIADYGLRLSLYAQFVWSERRGNQEWGSWQGWTATTQFKFKSEA
jgi:hypothetical protein